MYFVKENDNKETNDIYTSDSKKIKLNNEENETVDCVEKYTNGSRNEQYADGTNIVLKSNRRDAR